MGKWNNDLTFSQVCVLMLKQQNEPLPSPGTEPHEGDWYNDAWFDLVVAAQQEKFIAKLHSATELNSWVATF